MDLSSLRETLNDIDSRIVDLYLRRMETVRQVGQYKREHGLPVLDTAREQELLDRVSALAGREGDGVRALFSLLLEQSRACQLKDGEAQGVSGTQGPAGA